MSIERYRRNPAERLPLGCGFSFRLARFFNRLGLSFQSFCLQAFGKLQQDGVQVHIQEVGIVVQHSACLHGRRQMLEIPLLQRLQVMHSNMRMAFDFFQGQAERFAALAQRLPNAGKDALQFRLLRRKSGRPGRFCLCIRFGSFCWRFFHRCFNRISLQGRVVCRILRGRIDRISLADRNRFSFPQRQAELGGFDRCKGLLVGWIRGFP